MYLLTPRTDQPGHWGPTFFYRGHLWPAPQVPCPYWLPPLSGMRGKPHTHLTGGWFSLSSWEEDEPAAYQKEASLGFDMLIDTPFLPPPGPGWALGSGPRVKGRPGMGGGPQICCPWVIRSMCLGGGGGCTGKGGEEKEQVAGVLVFYIPAS